MHLLENLVPLYECHWSLLLVLDSLFGIHLQTISWVNLQTVAAWFCLSWFFLFRVLGFLLICLIIGLELDEYIQECAAAYVAAFKKFHMGSWPYTCAMFYLFCLQLILYYSELWFSGFFPSASVAFYCRGNWERQCISYGKTICCP